MLAGAARQVYNSPIGRFLLPYRGIALPLQGVCLSPIGRLQQTLYPLHIMPYSATLLTKDIKKC